MKIYHGTHYKNLNTILKSGLTPRKDKEGNWEKYPSHSQMIYLSLAYPFYFALSAGEKISKGVVIEIDTEQLDENNFYPDEDFVFQKLEQQGQEGAEHTDIKENIESYQEYWEMSLNCFGGFCYKGTIPPSAFTKYCIVDFKQRKKLSFEMLQPIISLLNYKLRGDTYEGLVKWCFGYIPTLPYIEDIIDLDDINNIIKELPKDTSKQIKDILNFNKETLEQKEERNIIWRKESEDRTGIKVITL